MWTKTESYSITKDNTTLTLTQHQDSTDVLITLERGPGEGPTLTLTQDEMQHLRETVLFELWVLPRARKDEAPTIVDTDPDREF